MGKARMYGYFKPVTPNNRALCPKKKTKQRHISANAKKADNAGGDTK